MGSEYPEVIGRGEHYRALARAIFSLVPSVKSAEARNELEALATDYELRAACAESQSRARGQRQKSRRSGSRQPRGYWAWSAQSEQPG